MLHDSLPQSYIPEPQEKCESKNCNILSDECHVQNNVELKEIVREGNSETTDNQSNKDNEEETANNSEINVRINKDEADISTFEDENDIVVEVSDDLSSKSMKELKNICVSKNISSIGKKADLIARISAEN